MTTTVEVVDGNRTYMFRGRLAAMVRWLAANAKRVSEPQKIQLAFDCAGSSVSAELKEREQVDPAFSS
jgi:hypothetical protein